MKHLIRILTLLLSLLSIVSLVACNGDGGKPTETAETNADEALTDEDITLAKRIASDVLSR